MNTDAMNTEQPQESFGSGASEAPAARSAELRSLPTPGPWLVSSTVLVCTTEARIVANCMPMDEPTLAVPYAHVEANAILIAAAPELAEQLLEALEFIEDHADVSDGPDGSPRPNRAMQLCEPIRAALAKAGVKP